MNYQDKTRDELINELKKLQQEYDSIKESYEKYITSSKLVEKTLKESEERFRLLFENSGEAILLTNPDGSIYSVNPEACRIYGRSEDEICKIGRSGLADLNDPHLEPALTDRNKTGKFKGELNQIRKDGTIFPAEVSSTIFIDSSGNKRTSMFIRDISERKQVEKELALQSEIMKNISEGINLITYEDEIIVFTNPKFDEMFGYGYGELIGKDVSILNAPTSNCPEETKQDIVDAINRTGDWHGEILNIKKNGNSFWCYVDVSVFSHPDYGKVYLSVHSDITERKRSETAKRESEELFRIVISNAPISIFATNEKGIFLLHDGKALEKVGMKPGENVGVSAFDLFSELKVIQHNGEVINGESVLTRVLNGERLSGFTELNGVHFDNQFVPIFGINDNIKGLIGVATDVTTSRKMEVALRESEVRFRSIFENSFVGISIARPGGRLLQVNLAYARMYGYENPEILLSEVNDTTVLFAHPEERKEVLRELQRNGFMEAKEFELIRRDGSHFFVLVSACEIRDSEGQLLYNQATHIDLTERKKIEEQIRAASLYSRSLIEASLDPLVTINAEGKITDVNISTEQITGIGREDLIGTDFADIFTSPDKARKGYKTVFTKGVVKDYPLTILNKLGKKIDVLFNVTLYKNEAREEQGIFAAARDITDQRKMGNELRKSKKLLEKLNQHLHDVRENERAVISREIHDELGQSMTALKLDLNRMFKYVNFNHEASVQLNSMIELVSDTIKDVQRISSELRPGILDDLGLVPAIEWYCDEFEKRTGIRCSLRLDDSTFIDPQKNLVFFRVLQEALTNVIRHANASSVGIRLHQSKQGNTMTIQDNGIGILPGKAESGKSLGLIGMRERVRQFGGKVVISSEKGQGTKLTVFIPSK